MPLKWIPRSKITNSVGRHITGRIGNVWEYPPPPPGLWVFVSPSTGVAEVHSSPWIRFFNLWRDGQEALGCKFYSQRVAEFLLHRMFTCKQRSRWNQLKAKQASQSKLNNALFNLTYEASDILNVNLLTFIMFIGLNKASTCIHCQFKFWTAFSGDI